MTPDGVGVVSLVEEGSPAVGLDFQCSGDTIKNEEEPNSYSLLCFIWCIDLSEDRSHIEHSRFSNFTTKIRPPPQTRQNFWSLLSTNPCRGVSLQSHLGKLAPLLRKFRSYCTQRQNNMHFIVPTILTTSFRRNWKILRPKRPRPTMRPLTAEAHPTPIDVIYRAKYGTHTGHAKTFSWKCFTFKHIETTSFGRDPGNIKSSTNTQQYGVVCSSHPYPQPALLLCHTVSHESITIYYNATILSIVVGQTVRRSTLTTQFVSSSRQKVSFRFAAIKLWNV